MKKLVFMVVFASQVILAGDNTVRFGIGGDILQDLEKLARCSSKIPSIEIKINVENAIDASFDEFIFLLQQVNKGEIQRGDAIEKLKELRSHIPKVVKSRVDDTFDIIFPTFSEDGRFSHEKVSFRVTNQ